MQSGGRAVREGKCSQEAGMPAKGNAGSGDTELPAGKVKTTEIYRHQDVFHGKIGDTFLTV